MIRKSFALLFAILFSLALFSCSEETVASEEDAVILSKKAVSFSDIGETLKLDYYVIKDGLKAPELSAEVVWTTSDPTVAICEDGLITATGYGSCAIRASFGNKYEICMVQTPNPNALLTISHSDVLLDNIGAVEYIDAFSESGEEISSSIEWVSSNENIATCEGGKLIATGYGSCTITARNKTESAVCTVTVNNPTAPTVTLSAQTLNLEVGDVHTLTAKTGNNAGEVLLWKSSNDDVASCKNGRVAAYSEGVCVILAITENGYSGYTVVTVGNPEKNADHAPYLDFEFKNLGRELKFVNKTTGEVETSLLVYDYEMETLLLNDGRLVVEISLMCVKTFDAEGIEGTAPSAVTASIYRENDIFCDKKQYRTSSLSIGDVFVVKCSGFTVQTTTDGTLRELYMTFSTITEHEQISR